MTTYQQRIREELARMGRLGMDPRHVEAYMRLEHSTLDGLSPAAFRREVHIGAECVDAAGLIDAESCARSFAL